MKVLVSPASIEEAKLVLQSNADIVDIKNPSEGSLGASFPWIVKEICDIKASRKNVLVSATLGDLPFKPGTASLAAYGAVCCGVDYLKVGLHNIKNYDEAFLMMSSVVRSVRMLSEKVIVVAAGYADYKRFGGLNYIDLVKAAKDSKSDVVMVDTAIKDGKNLFDALTVDEIKHFIELAHDANLQVALAGSLKVEHIDILCEFKGVYRPDIVGVRGAVCENHDRTKGISISKISEFLKYVNKAS